MVFLSLMPKALKIQRAQHFFLRSIALFPNDSQALRLKSYFCSAIYLNYKLQIKLNAFNKIRHYCNSAGTDNKKSSFQQMLHFRKKQAQSSVLLELISKEDIICALSSCEKFGAIKNAFTYSGISKNIFLLLEFEEEESVRKMLLSSNYKNVIDAFPVLNRILGYTKRHENDVLQTSVSVLEDAPFVPPLKEGTISDLIENIYVAEKLTELNIRLRFLFCSIVKELLSGIFPFCDAIPFGSSVNGIGRHGCDLDLMVRLYPEEILTDSELYFVNKTCVGDVQNLQRKVVYCMADLLRTFSPGVTAVQKILHARVPIIKLDHKILGMKIDISVNNIAPVFMSEVLHYWGEVDFRIRPLIYAVKKWAKEVNVTYEAPGSWITNFALTLLVVFFLQNRPSPILPPINETFLIKGAECTVDYKLEYLKSLYELQVKASSNKESLALLLKEFLQFLGSHPFENKHYSLLSGIATEKMTDSAIWLQYPFEEGLNVAKNVSEHEMGDMCEKARASAKFLGSNMSLKGMQSKDLSVLLGIPNIRKLDGNKSKRLDVSLLLGEDAKNLNKKPVRRRAF